MDTKREPTQPALWGYRPMFRAATDAARYGSEANLCKEKLGKTEYSLNAGYFGRVVRG